MKSIVLKGAVMLMAAGCLFAAWLALSWGLADRAAYDARQSMRDWAYDGIASETKLARSIEGMRTAVSFAPNHPDYRDQLAKWLLMAYLLNHDQADAEEARAHLAHSSQIRPHWGGNLSTLIDLKFYLDEIDSDLFEAIALAERTNAWEPDVIQALVRVGSRHYAQLPGDQQREVISAIERGLRSPVKGLANRVVKLTREAAADWQLDFVRSLAVILSSDDWPARNQAAHTELALLIWPVASAAEKERMTVQIADVLATHNNRRIRQLVVRSGRLIAFCPRLPRTKNFRRLCEDSRILK